MGGNIRWRPWDGVTLKVVAGVPQKFQEYAPVRIYGTDGEIDLGSLLFPETECCFRWVVPGYCVMTEVMNIM